MRVLADESIPRMTVELLRKLGHDVRDLRGTRDQGLGDPELWAPAQSENRLLITTGRGFTEFGAASHRGILIVRLRQPNRLRIHNAVMLASDRFQEQEWPDLLAVVRDSTLSVSRGGSSVERE